MIVKASTKYGEIYVSDVDHIGKILLNGEYFEEELINIILPHIIEQSNILDIGANVGNFSLAFLKTRECMVHAFEPQKFVINLLEKTFSTNEHIKLYHNAVGDKNCKVNLHNIDWKGDYYNPEICDNLGGVKVGTGGEEVEMITIDQLSLKNISVIKIDAEGCEKQIIEGAMYTIIRERPFIAFESHHLSYNDVNFIIDFLNSLNYNCKEIFISNLKNYICNPK